MITLAIMWLGFLQPLMIMPEIEWPDIEIGANHEESKKDSEELSIIVEVEGSPKKQAKHIETYYPEVEVVEVYQTLFQGLALKGAAEKMVGLKDLDFVKGTYPAQVYITLHDNKPMKNSEILADHSNANMPATQNRTEYTGEGSKIGVIDTGIDFTHPDLKNNYRGGFDLIDLEDEPMETMEDEGIPTLHGTHVAGIIAADGALKGVAPDSELYAYRALGPGGVGTSVHVLAALEEAVNADMDIVNLSLGNTINGPDYPTSKAVNEAVEQGVAVVVANGNDGPKNWTIGAPATAPKALSVGAYADPSKAPVLYEPNHKKEIILSPLMTSWDLDKDYLITESIKEANGKLVMINQKTEDILSKLEEAEKENAAGVLVHLTDPDDEEWRAEIGEFTTEMPIAFISNEDGQWIKQREQTESYYKIGQKEVEEQVAKFSSRGPVTVNWMMKPDVIAPGVNIASTVPGGYEILNGTSMAAPHVAGELAVLKEAHPDWTNEQLINAIKTTAYHMPDISPIDQGAGLVNVSEAISTDVIIHDPLLSFGKIHEHINERTVEITMENLSDQDKQFHFNMPEKKAGQTWKLPQPFELKPKEKKTIPLTLKLDNMRINENLVQGHLELIGENQTYQLPYAAVSDDEDFPRVMGFRFEMEEAAEDHYKYSLYAGEPVKKMTLRLYDPDTLTDEGTLLETTDIEPGMNEGTIKKREIEQRGYYYGMVIAENETGDIHTYETEIFIE